jgi:hypothetical protein
MVEQNVRSAPLVQGLRVRGFDLREDLGRRRDFAGCLRRVRDGRRASIASCGAAALRIVIEVMD